MIKAKSTTVIILAISVAVIISSVGIYRIRRQESPRQTKLPTLLSATSTKIVVSETTNMTLGRPKMIIPSGDAQYMRDLNDNENLMGDSHNVFVAKVIRQTASQGWNTLFDVQVIKNIKGGLEGVVPVSVTGGYKGDAFYVMDGATWLQPGSTYLLATRYAGGDTYHLISFPAAWKIISQDSNLTDSQLLTLAGGDSRVQQLEKAYTNEIPLPVDLAHNNALNDYQSLTEAQKYALPFYTGSYNPNPPAPTSTASSTGF